MRLLIVFFPVNVNIHIFYRNINIFDYELLAQTLMGDYLILSLFLKSERFWIFITHWVPKIWGLSYTTFVEHLLCARCYSKHFTHMKWFNTHDTLGDMFQYWPHLTGKKTGTQRSFIICLGSQKISKWQEPSFPRIHGRESAQKVSTTNLTWGQNNYSNPWLVWNDWTRQS